ncbi:Histamine H1 receptor [Holothuria leucospilota]|uniref:Histamine H1 receptor n=1 Tax=Holothuria leucospilota TaxID=206669 RepID=A0A9Q0YL14_HOLLE|nr:Histamine H1 receptor [Holothuria leucospilota]
MKANLESLAQIQNIGNRLNHPKIVLKTDNNGKEDVGEKDADGQVASNDKSGLPQKPDQRKSRRGNERRQWDVTDEILLLKKIEGEDRGDYKTMNDPSTIPATSEQGQGVQMEEHPVNGNMAVSSLKDDKRMSNMEAETERGTETELQQVPSSSNYNDGKPFIRFHRIRQERKTAILFVFIMMVLFVFWSPIYIIDIFLAFEVNVNQNLINFAVLLSHFNSAVNPLLYAYKRLKEIENIDVLPLTEKGSFNQPYGTSEKDPPLTRT